MTKKNNVEEMSPEQLFKLGTEYEHGIGVEQDAKMAVLLYRRAAEQGNARAQLRIGLLYVWSTVAGEQKVNEGVRLLRLSAAQGDAEAQNTLGTLYYKGLKVEKDIKEAFRLYRLAANQGNMSAQYNLGYSYQNGIFVEKDAKEAARFYRLAVEQKHVEAQYQLGVMSQEGIGVEKDAKEAVRLYRLVADEHPGAQYQLAVCYHDGIGVEKNIKEALHVYRLIIDNSYATHVVIGQDAKEDMLRAKAECTIGNYYVTGEHPFEKDPIKAVRLFQLAAQKGVMPSKTILTSCYQNIGLMKMKNKREVNEIRYWQTEVEKFSGKQIEFII